MNPGISLRCILEYVLAKHNVRICKTTIHNYLQKSKISKGISREKVTHYCKHAIIKACQRLQYNVPYWGEN